MCIPSGAPSAPSLPPPPEPIAPPPPPPEPVDPEVRRARSSNRRRAALAQGARPISTTPQGITTPAFTTRKTLLGQ